MTENQELRIPGKTTIAPEVLVTIAKLTTQNVQGVKALSPMPRGVQRFFSRGMNDDGVRIIVENASVYADLYVILSYEMNIREVSRKIQQQVARAISEMVGMSVGKVDVHVEDILFDSSSDTA